MNDFRKRHAVGFTLVELLVVITLIAFISGMLSVALTSSQQEAKIRRCRGEMLNYGQLVQARFGAVSFQPLQIRTHDTPNAATAASGMGSYNPFQGASDIRAVGIRKRIASEDQARLNLAFRRDFARMVLPQCREDLYLPPASMQSRVIPPGRTTSTRDMQASVSKTRVPALYDRMREVAGMLDHRAIDREAKAFLPAGQRNPMTEPIVDAIDLYATNSQFAALCRQRNVDIDGDGVSDAWTREHESSECLYLILATLQAMGQSAVDQIPRRNIGDTDGDGMPEILDPWGTPVRFLREPVGLRVPGFGSWRPLEQGTDLEYPSDPDPFDFLLADFRYNPALTNDDFKPIDPQTGAPVPDPVPPVAFHPTFISPVIISAGSDGEFGIYTVESLFELDTSASPATFSSSAVVLTTPPSPVFAVGGVNLKYRFPDPFQNFKAVLQGASGAGEVAKDFEGIVMAKRGGGLGGYLSDSNMLPLDEAIEAAGDNIYSIDSSL